MADTFRAAPEKVQKPDGSVVYNVYFAAPHVLPYTIHVGAGGKYVGTVVMQNHIETLRESMLIAIARTPTLFKSPPTMQSLHAITPVWGFLFQGARAEGVWGPHGCWANPDVHPASGDNVQMSLVGVEISRRSILPIWEVTICPATCIDFDFESTITSTTAVLEEESASEDGRSVCSVDFIPVEEGAPVCLRNADARKRATKAEVKEALRRARVARRVAEAAEEAFFAEFDLSEDESDFSSDDDE